MAYSLYNPNENYYKAKFWLAKPNKQIITRLKEIDETASLNTEFGKINELSFTIPYYKEKNNQTIVNPNIQHIRGKYLIKMEFMEQVEWFVIDKFSKEVNEHDSIPATAYSLQHELTFKKIYEIEVTSVLPVDIINQVLDKTGWKAGVVDPILASKYRSYTFSNTSSLDCLYQIAETTNGILQFDTVNQTVSLYDESTLSKFNGLVINDKNYLETLTDEKGASEIVTRLYPMGNEGLTINSYNPSGTSYLEDFSYFLYPFERDPITKETLKSSYYFSDELAHATLDYQDLIKSKEDDLKTAKDSRDVLQTELTTLKNELAASNLKYKQMQDLTYIMKANREYAAKSTVEAYEEMDLREGTYFTQMRVQHGTADLWVAGKKYNLTSTWKSIMVILPEDGTVLYEAENFSDSSNNGIQFYTARIPFEEESWTHDKLAEKYNMFILQTNIKSQETSVASKEAEVKTVTDSITAIHDEIALANNFTPELIEERERYIHEEYWVEENHVNAKELYEDALEKFKTINHPSTTMNLGIINFLAMTGEIRNWKKLTLGSKSRTVYSRLNVESESILIQINYDFENKSINLALSDTKDLLTDDEKLVKMLYSSTSSSNYLALKKFIYDDAVQKSNAVEELLNETWDATYRRIVAGTNESVEVGDRGIVIRNPHFPDHILIAQAGVLAISHDNGMSFKNALTTDGLIAERIVGRILIGQKLWIEDANGIVTIKGDQIEIKDNLSQPRVIMGQYEVGKYGIKIENGALEIVGGLKREQLSTDLLGSIQDTLEGEIGRYRGMINDLKLYVESLYGKPSVSESEKAGLYEKIKSIESEKNILDGKFDILANNLRLPIEQRDALDLAKTSILKPFGYSYIHDVLLADVDNFIYDDNFYSSYEQSLITQDFIDMYESLDILATRVEEARVYLKDETTNKLRTDLRMTAPLPSSIKLDENGFTAYQETLSNYARLDHRGLYVQGGAIDIRTSTLSNRGVSFDATGIKGYNIYGVKTFDLESDGNFTMTGGTFRSINGDSSMWLSGGTMQMLNTSGETLEISPTGFYGKNANNSIRFQADAAMVTSAALGTSNANVYLGSTNETRSVHFSSLPGDGLVDSYAYTPVRASGFFGTFVDTTATHLYLRPAGDPGEVRVTVRGGTTTYQPIRVSSVRANILEINELFGVSTNMYIGVGSGSETRNVIKGTIDTFAPIRASGFIEASSEDYKEDITEWNYDALSVIMNEWQAYQYKFKGDTQNIYRRGSIVEKLTPAEFINGKGINTYEMNTWNMRAVQQLGKKDLEQDREILELKQRVAELELANQTA